MPTTITDVNNYTPSIQTVSDGDGATGANFALAPQGLANRCTNLKSRLDAITSTADAGGVRAIRSFANTAALQASTDYTDGQVCMVSLQGLYQFNAASSATALTPLVITPTAVGAGAGRWILLAPYGVANGIAALDSTARVAAPNVRNGLISATQTLLTSGNFVSSSTSMTDVTGLAVSVAAAVGDLLVIDAIPMVQISSGSTSPVNTMKVVVVDGGSTLDTGTLSSNGVTVTLNYSMSTIWTVLNAGTVTAKVQISAGSGNQLTVLGGSSAAAPQSRIRVLQYRP